MEWKLVKVPTGGKLFRGHRFHFIYSGANFLIEVDEYSDGTFSGHAENATDENYVIQSVSGTSIEDCLSNVLSKIQSRN